MLKVAVIGALVFLGLPAALPAQSEEDVAETMMSLVQTNRFVTGEVIVIDGGFSSST